MKFNLIAGLSALLVAASMPLAAQAGTCTATNAFADPAATVTNSTDCGSGNKDNDDATNVNSLTPGGFADWARIDRAGDSGNDSENDILLMSGAGTGGGDWAFDDQTGYDTYMLVIKDGVIPDGKDPNAVSWFWFIVDTAAGCTLGSFSGLNDYCGEWTMYGEKGSAKNISHLTLFARNAGGGDDDEDDDDEVPEPASLALVGLGLAGLALARRRGRKQ